MENPPYSRPAVDLAALDDDDDDKYRYYIVSTFFFYLSYLDMFINQAFDAPRLINK